MKKKGQWLSPLNKEIYLIPELLKPQFYTRNTLLVQFQEEEENTPTPSKCPAMSPD